MPNDWKSSTGQRIERLYVWIAEEADGGEGVCSIQLGDIHFPMVGADRERIESLRPYAQQAADVTGLRVRLVEFSDRTVRAVLNYDKH
jgi:hypothetical protein